ncbi:glycosyltransferase family 1 protein [candidate division KSB1 bacterium]|nr:alpha-glucan family phosphorylase [candidate division KSB1 bacterium]RQW02547.1 MAG: glycosyltransferase family 1 protein [candidate division KSB1 bacterium]
MTKYKIQNIRVTPRLPKKLSYLRELAYNLYWSWDHNSRTLFRRLDPDLWEEVNRNPVLMLGSVSQERLEYLAQNEGYLAEVTRVQERIENYMTRKSWYEEEYGDRKNFNIAYFSMEYGLGVGLPIYSGGLGILAGDHLKSASDLGLPFFAVGLAYQNGFFQQYLAADGWQQETYPVNDFYNLPMLLEKDDNDQAITVEIEFPGRAVTVQIWRVQVGRVPLYLLDANIPQNSEADRKLTAQLYGGDNEMRIQQEIILGIGGVRTLKALGVEPNVCHMNEGHSAFLSLERARLFMKSHKGITFAEAREATRFGNVFTTHTPVPAGIDEFDPGLVEHYLGLYYTILGVSTPDFLQLGGVHLPQTKGKFNMAIFAINMANGYNGVSRLHGHVARHMWNYLWPDISVHEVPIGRVTNGIHVRTWLSSDMSELFSRYLDPNWYRHSVDESMWDNIDQIPDEELWRTHERRRERLVAFARRRLANRLKKLGAHPGDVERAIEVLKPEVLTIGFARRFAAYKRAYLFFRDQERLKKILNHPEHPVQMIIAGKAHPADKIGKEILKNIMSIIAQDDFRDKIVFLENYDMKVASYILQGVDIWLNNPRRPREASGTSGMKASANGVLNLSILDGWWDEAYEMNKNIGWAIGRGEEKFTSEEEQDDIDSAELYHILETDVIPTFYDRGRSGIPREWLKMMKTNMKTVCPYFNTNRMVRNYLHDFYFPAAENWARVSNDSGKAARQLVKWRENLNKNWETIKILTVQNMNADTLKIGEQIKVSAQVKLGAMKPQDVQVQLYLGRVDQFGDLQNTKALPMILESPAKDGVYTFCVTFAMDSTGQHGFSVRVVPNHPLNENPMKLGLIKWYSDES